MPLQYPAAAVGVVSIKAVEAQVTTRCKEGKMPRALCISWVLINLFLSTRGPSHHKFIESHAWQQSDQSQIIILEDAIASNNTMNVSPFHQTYKILLISIKMYSVRAFEIHYKIAPPKSKVVFLTSKSMQGLGFHIHCAS